MVLPLIGAVISGAMGMAAANKKAKAIDRMNDQNNQYLNAAMPYVKDNLELVKGDYTDMRDAGPYTGDYFADPNQMQTDANASLYDLGMGQVGLSNDLTNATKGFTGNANTLFNKFSDMSNRPDVMAGATQYAQDNMNPIVDALMRDSKRTLTEQTLPGINQAASGSGNVNSSRAGVADAIATRDYEDRLMDTKTDVFNQLRNDAITQKNTEFNQGINALTNANMVNNTLGSTFFRGNDLAAAGVTSALGAGNNQNTWDQARMNADRANYDYTTGYNYNLGKDYGAFLAGGSPGSGNYQLNAVNPAMAGFGAAKSGFGALGGMGGMAPGFGGQGGSFGNSSFFDPLFGGPGLGLSF